MCLASLIGLSVLLISLYPVGVSQLEALRWKPFEDIKPLQYAYYDSARRKHSLRTRPRSCSADGAHGPGKDKLSTLSNQPSVTATPRLP
jgi:hypothetical protein